MKSKLAWIIIKILCAWSLIGCNQSNLTNNQDLPHPMVKKESDQISTIKIGMWNIANYFENDSDLFFQRKQIINDVLNSINLDLLVVIEPTYTNKNGFKKLVQMLNKTNSSKMYDSIISLPNFSDLQLYQTSSLVERFGFIYNTKKLKFNHSPYQQKPLKINQNLTSNLSNALNKSGNQNILFFNEKKDEKYFYTRKPGAVQWTNLLTNKTFVTIASHASSPGANANQNEKNFLCNNLLNYGINDLTKCINKKNNNVRSELGENEAFDALKISLVINQFAKTFNDNNIYFFGDTNIKCKDNFVFDPIFNNNLKSLFPLENKNDKKSDYEKYKTTLSTKINNYANSYDKVFYKTTDNKITNSTRFNLWSLYYDNNLNNGLKIKKNKIMIYPYTQNRYYTKTYLDQIYYQQLKKQKPKDLFKSANSLKFLTSDHTLVYFDLN